MDKTPLPSVGVIIVNWNRKTHTLNCIESLLSSDYKNYEILIVDNASTDGSVESIRRQYPELLVLCLPTNCGFTGGNNSGIAYFLSKGMHYFFLLNNDALVSPSTLSVLVKYAELNPQAGFLGPIVRDLENPEVIISAGGYLDGCWTPVHQLEITQDATPQPVDFVSGCALLVNRRIIESVGFLDNNYFAYHEEIDWCFRGKLAGYQTLLVPGATVLHPNTFRRDENSPLVTYYISRNSLIFVRKHHLGMGNIAKLLFSYMNTLVSWTLRPRWRNKRSQRNALAQAMIDFALRRFGPAEHI